MDTFPVGEAVFQLQGPVGELEVATSSYKEDVSPRAITVVICHPHPLFGGTMNNKVVTTLMRAFRDLGLRVVRFNFRGVGKSAGAFAEGVGELDDVLSVVDWVKKVNPQDEIWLAGFSFGAAMSARAATRVAVSQLVSIAPPVPRFGLLNLPPVTCPWLIVQGEDDDVVIPQDVYNWVEGLNPKPQLVRVREAGHFFHGKLLELRQILEENL